jgi:hypothetical protein
MSTKRATVPQPGPTSPKRPYPFVSIYFADAPRGRETEAIIDEHTGTVIEGEITGYYYADISFSATPIPPDTDGLEVDFQVMHEVREDPDTLKDDSLKNAEAAHEAAHDDCRFEAREYLRELGYREFAYRDQGALNAEESSGIYSLDPK